MPLSEIHEGEVLHERHPSAILVGRGASHASEAAMLHEQPPDRIYFWTGSRSTSKNPPPLSSDLIKAFFENKQEI